jgi:hypothetical protein
MLLLPSSGIVPSLYCLADLQTFNGLGSVSLPQELGDVMISEILTARDKGTKQ